MTEAELRQRIDELMAANQAKKAQEIDNLSARNNARALEKGEPTIIQPVVMEQPKPRGRPKGSRNKPKEK